MEQPSVIGSKSSAGFVEFKLRSTSSTNYVHNVMTIGGPAVNVTDFTTPVRLVRDPSLRGEDGGPVNLSDTEDKNIARKKRKTRIIQREDEEEQALRVQERAPWLLEDFDGQHSYVSQLLAPDSKYVIFVNQGNEFRVLLASKWYKFAPKLAYRPLTLEEAEEKMASKGRNEDFDRWLMRKRSPSASGPASGESSGIQSVLPAQNGPKVATRLVNLEEEGFDFEEFVDDDDGEGLYHGNTQNDEEDPSAPRIEKSRPVKNLTDAGRQVKKLVKNLDRASYNYGSDDEEGFDPYADEEDQEPSEDEEKPELPKIVVAPPQPTNSKPLHPQRSSESFLGRPLARSRSKSPSGSSSRTRSKSPTATPRVPANIKSGASSPPKSPIPSPKATSTVLTETEIIVILREAPLRTKDLIARVKGKLRMDPQNKEVFREIVRRVAIVKASTSQEEDKLLELKPEYR
jgi:hypothetical protein